MGVTIKSEIKVWPLEIIIKSATINCATNRSEKSDNKRCDKGATIDGNI